MVGGTDSGRQAFGLVDPHRRCIAAVPDRVWGEVVRLNAEFDVPRMDAGDGGGAGSGAGNGEVADLMSSLAPLLQHFAGALQQSGAPTPLQQQVVF